jgi:hypothetical protein
MIVRKAMDRFGRIDTLANIAGAAAGLDVLQILLSGIQSKTSRRRSARSCAFGPSSLYAFLRRPRSLL